MDQIKKNLSKEQKIVDFLKKSKAHSLVVSTNTRDPGYDFLGLHYLGRVDQEEYKVFVKLFPSTLPDPFDKISLSTKAAGLDLADLLMAMKGLGDGFTFTEKGELWTLKKKN